MSFPKKEEVALAASINSGVINAVIIPAELMSEPSFNALAAAVSFLYQHLVPHFQGAPGAS